MSKSTAAVIMVSAAKLPPWGDDGWRIFGAMQLVHDGPDWLYAQWPVLDGAEHRGSDRFAKLVLRDNPSERAADIAVMVFALLQIPEWQGLAPWWGPLTDREALADVLEGVAKLYAGDFKLAVIQTASGVARDVLEALRTLGFEVVEFAQVGALTEEG